MARRAFSLGLVTTFAMAALLTFGALPADAQKKGGVLRVGNLGEPPALDAHWTTASITETLTNHIYEGLFSLDRDNKPIPMLAESYTVGKDGLTYTFKLRQGVKFHNGKEMTSEDVVASLNRWGKQSIYGKALFAQVAELRGVDPYTVEMKLKEKSAIVLISLAVPNNFGAIYPKEIAEKFAPEVKVTEYVGTGPYKLAEWKPDQYIRMVRFDDYKSRSEKPNGYG
ncbi:MAG TPA: ABC transporter substrate-binding protein, partial [Methylomirabilota bacterium]|nr:ABC transporter substrate-binding protein [Methylomirabilota bacterium]